MRHFWGSRGGHEFANVGGYTELVVSVPLAGLNTNAIREIAARYGARNLRVFGSMARGDHNTSSDVDVLVDLDAGRTLLDLVALKQDLEDMLGRPVDVVTEQSLSPHVREGVLATAVTI